MKFNINKFIDLYKDIGNSITDLGDYMLEHPLKSYIISCIVFGIPVMITVEYIMYKYYNYTDTFFGKPDNKVKNKESESSLPNNAEGPKNNQKEDNNNRSATNTLNGNDNDVTNIQSTKKKHVRNKNNTSDHDSTDSTDDSDGP